MTVNAPVLQPGESILVPATKHVTYTVVNDGWGFRVSVSSGAIVVKHNPDGSVQIGCSGSKESEDEV